MVGRLTQRLSISQEMLASSPIRPAVSEPIALPAKSLLGMRNRDLDDDDNNLDNHNVKVNLTAQNEGGEYDGEDYDNANGEDDDQFEDVSYQGRALALFCALFLLVTMYSICKYSNTKQVSRTAITVNQILR